MGGATGQALGGHRASRIWAWRACKALGFVIFGLGFVISRLGFVILRLGFALARLGFEDLRLEGFEGARLRRFGANFPKNDPGPKMNNSFNKSITKTIFFWPAWGGP